MSVIFESIEIINGINFEVSIFDDGGAIIQCKRRRSSFMVIYNPKESTVSVRTRREWQLWEAVPSINRIFQILEDESYSFKWSNAQAGLMRDVSQI